MCELVIWFFHFIGVKIMNTHIPILEELVASGGPMPAQYAVLDNMLDQLAILPPEEAAVAVNRVRTVLAPTLTQDTMQGFALLKPHGYSGDYEIIDRIYQGWTSPHDHLERWDHYFHLQAGAAAVRNRKDYFIQTVRELGNTPSQILNVASGPGRDLLECLEQSDIEHFFTCLDIDERALDHSFALCARFAERVGFCQGSAIRFRSSKYFDLVWSGGLFDYFSDRVFVITLKSLLRVLAPGGKCVIGNFSTSHTSRPYMEIVGDWQLIHRTPEQLIELALKAGAVRHQIEVKEEELGVNLFLHITRE